MADSASILVWAGFLHLVADWLLQTEWMAQNKADLRHPAGWIHGGIHAAILLLVFPWPFALLTGLLHVLIDTLAPVLWWMAVVKGMPDPECDTPTFTWMDQICHVIVLGLVILLL